MGELGCCIARPIGCTMCGYCGDVQWSTSLGPLLGVLQGLIMLLLRQSLALVAAPLLLLLPLPPLRVLLALVLMPVLMPVLVPVVVPVLFLHLIFTFGSDFTVAVGHPCQCAWLPIGRPLFWT